MAKAGVTNTALFVAAVRAREGARPEPLFKDELSAVLAGREGIAWLAASEVDPQSNYRRDSFPYLEVRTRFFDDWLLGSLRAAKANQVVLLGAGMDTRAFRLAWPKGVKLWEVDTHDLFSIKERRLRSAGAAPLCSRLVVESDLSKRGWSRALVGEGFSTDRPAVWLAEGLFEYLSAKAVGDILATAASLSPMGSRLGAEIISEEYMKRPTNRPAMERRRGRGAAWRFGTDDPEALFKARGWKVESKVGASEAAVAFGRWAPDRPSRAGPPPASFVSSIRLG